MSDTTVSPWLTTKQVASYLQLHEKSVLRLLRQGVLRGHQPSGAGGCWRVHAEDADAYVRGVKAA